MAHTFKQDGKLYVVRGIPGSPLRMVQETYKTPDSPTGYYTTGPVYFVDHKGQEVYRQ